MSRLMTQIRSKDKASIGVGYGNETIQPSHVQARNSLDKDSSNKRCTLTLRTMSVMSTSLDDRAARRERRSAMLRVFGVTFLTFIALLLVAAYVRPDLMQTAIGMVKVMMP